MQFTHEELLEAVRQAGRDGQPFTCAAVRDQLHVSTRDRRELSRFHRCFRAFQDAAASEIERVGNNSFRLRTRSLQEEVDSAFETIQAVTPPAPVVVEEPEREPSKLIAASLNIGNAKDSARVISLHELSSGDLGTSDSEHAALVELSSEDGGEAADSARVISLDELVPNVLVSPGVARLPQPKAAGQARFIGMDELVSLDAREADAQEGNVVALQLYSVPDFDAAHSDTASAQRRTWLRRGWLGRRVAGLLGRA